MRKLSGFLALGFFVVLSGCSQSSFLERTTLFSLNIGKMEDQLDILLDDTPQRNYNNQLLMRDGIYYISSGKTNKIMSFSSYGDILSLFYDPQDNPRPVSLSVYREENTKTSKSAYMYDFNNIGKIALTSQRILLVDDQVVAGREEVDKNINGVLNRQIFRFTPEGEALDYLGQEGLGGTPFPYIESITVTAKDDIVVVCTTEGNWYIYWYDSNGTLLYKVYLSEKALPDSGVNRIASMGKIFPDKRSHRLLFNINYFIRTKAGERGQSGKSITFDESSLWIYDLDKKNYIGHLEIPKVQKRVDVQGVGQVNYEVLFDFIGTDVKGNLFFLSQYEEESSQFLIMSGRGRTLEKSKIEYGSEPSYIRNFTVTNEGILTGLLVKEDRVEVVWWRSDRVLIRN